MDGWMTFFLKAFQLYQEDERTIVKDCVQWYLFMVGAIFASDGARIPNGFMNTFEIPKVFEERLITQV
ncbi:MAG: hypothetical protein AB2693_06310 [Candidatus Thiodiazotropha sp.]